MLEIMRRQALQISARTGLKEDTCLDLLLNGWTVQTKADEPICWQSPLEHISLPPSPIKK